MKELQFTRHAVFRMAERNISTAEVRNVILNGSMIKDYPEDKPYPSKLYLGYSKDRPIHIVFAEREDRYIIISAYRPKTDVWEPDFKRRKL